VTAVQFLAQVLMWPGAGLTMQAGKRRKVEFSHIRGWSFTVYFLTKHCLQWRHLWQVWKCCRDVCKGACIKATGMASTAK
jgi:hypothetical protein